MLSSINNIFEYLLFLFLTIGQYKVDLVERRQNVNKFTDRKIAQTDKQLMKE